MSNRSDGSSSSQLSLTVNIESSAVAGSPRPVCCRAGVEAAVLHLGPADVDVADHLPVHRDVLPHHQPADGDTGQSLFQG